MDNGLMTLAFISAPGPMEIAVVLVIVLVVFGPGKLPEVFKALGSGLRQFKEAANPNLQSGNNEPPAIQKSEPPAIETPEKVAP